LKVDIPKRKIGKDDVDTKGKGGFMQKLLGFRVKGKTTHKGYVLISKEILILM
jgi:hypothetical protein